jgi:hypothetical protein
MQTPDGKTWNVPADKVGDVQKKYPNVKVLK